MSAVSPSTVCQQSSPPASRGSPWQEIVMAGSEPWSVVERIGASGRSVADGAEGALEQAPRARERAVIVVKRMGSPGEVGQSYRIETPWGRPESRL
ncbi:MAG: hypothetical protein KC635_01350 [Myxococcales bacterium]|nr:hypothetical protein [Myxococcales bacterium]MCB9737192.1 hypothetical protein [Deltaproteobacteria bacterium]